MLPRDAVCDTVFVYNIHLPEVVGSIRLVAFIPSRQLGTRALYYGPGISPTAFLDAHQPRVLIFTKAFDDSVLALGRVAGERGIKVVSAFCDLRLTGDVGRIDGELLRLSDAVTVPNAWMAGEISRRFGRPCTIVEDAFEYPRGTAAFTPGQPLKILWFGHSANHDTLVEGITALAAGNLGAIELLVVTYPEPELDDLDTLMRQARIRATYMPWSQLVQHEGLQWCDMVFLPSNDSWEKRMKSHNRVVETINAGRLAVAYPLPQYRELAAFCLCDGDYVSSIRAALADPLAVVNRIEDGQRYIDERFSPQRVADKWRAVISSVCPAVG